MKRNYSIDCIKLLLAISIACGHLRTSVLPSGMVVEVFFILSGFFLVQSFYGGKYQKDAVRYTASRLKRIYPYYLLAFVPAFLGMNAADLAHPVQLFRDLTEHIPELLLVQNVGVYDGGNNYPLWQLCTLLIACHVLFALMSWDDNLTLNAICPLAAIFAFTYLSNVYGSHTVDLWGVEYKFFYVPLLRAFGAVALGMVTYRPVCALAQWLRDTVSQRTAVFLSGLLLLFFWAGRNGYVAHLVFLFILAFCLAGKGIPVWLDRKVFACGEKLSLAIYLVHAGLVSVFQVVPMLAALPETIQMVLFIPVLLLYAGLFLFLADHLFAWIAGRSARAGTEINFTKSASDDNIGT